MPKAVAKEGPRAPLFCLGAALLLAASGTAAQTVAQSDLELCASLATAELKLACFEALTAIESRAAEPAASVTAQPQPESTVMEAASISAGAAARMAGSDVERVAPAPAAAAADADDNQADVADDLGRAHPDEEHVDLVDEIGREHLDQEQDGRNENTLIRASVSEVVKGSYDVLYFHLTNGQVWRQFEARHFRYPREGRFEVIISRGMMGDYRLRLDEHSPMTRIRRVK